MSTNRIDPTGSSVRMSTNVSIDRQTPKTDFGDRVRAGLDTAAGVVANGLAVAVPGGMGSSILSAAVSSVNQLSTPGGAAGTQYAAAGVVSMGGGSGLSTTLGGGVGGVSGGATGGMPTAAGVVGGGSGSMMPGVSLGNAQSGLSEQASQLGQMLQVQMQVQRENQVFTTVSNVLKTRHDTVKNTISNVR